jgi:hypothetical protein
LRLAWKLQPSAVLVIAEVELAVGQLVEQWVVKSIAIIKIKEKEQEVPNRKVPFEE